MRAIGSVRGAALGQRLKGVLDVMSGLTDDREQAAGILHHGARYRFSEFCKRNFIKSGKGKALL